MATQPGAKVGICGTCGRESQLFPSDDPLKCSRCSSHGHHSEIFHSKCPGCWADRITAIREGFHLHFKQWRMWRKYWKENRDVTKSR
jgi:predicted amidophosphoribosyltransferase